jgi:hypothetical protein
MRGHHCRADARPPDGPPRLCSRGMVPLIDDTEFSTTAFVLIDGREMLTRVLEPGGFELLTPLTPGCGIARVELRFGRLQTLPFGDRHRVAVRLRSAATVRLSD